MAIVSRVVSYTSAGSDSGGASMFYIKEFLKNQLGYVVRGSNDGTTAAFDGVDRITTQAIAVGGANRWIVLEDPGGSFQVCLARGATGGGTLTYKVNPITNAGPVYSGGTTSTLPTATRERVIFQDINFLTNTIGLVHRYYMTGQNTAPYGFAMFVKQGLSSTSTSGSGIEAGMAFVPIEQQVANAGCPYWFFGTLGNNSSGFLNTGDLGTASTTVNTNHGVMQIHDATGSPTAAPTGVACLMLWRGAACFPNNMGYDFTYDQTIPILLGVPGGLVAGVSTFMQWNGTPRNWGDTFNNLTRICFNTVSFPWDGSTIPTV